MHLNDKILEKIYYILCYLGHDKSCYNYDKIRHEMKEKNKKHEHSHSHKHKEIVSEIRRLKGDFMPSIGGTPSVKTTQIKRHEDNRHKHKKQYGTVRSKVRSKVKRSKRTKKSFKKVKNANLFYFK